MPPTAAIIFRLFAIAIAWFAVLSRYYLATKRAGWLQGNINFFSYFTTLTNLAAACALTAALLVPGSFLTRPAVRTAIAVYILAVVLIFFLLLRQRGQRMGFDLYVNYLLHYINPILYLLDWTLFTSKSGLRYNQIPAMLIYPALYVAYTLLHGAVSGWYPYPFFAASRFGYAKIGTNIAGLGAFFIFLSAAFITIGRRFTQ